MRKLLLSLVALTVVAALPGCDSASPTEIAGGAQSFEGALAAEGTATHSFTVTREGGIVVEVLNVAYDPPREGDPQLALGLGLGRLDSAGDCRLTFQTGIVTGSRQAFAVDRAEYCFQVTDRGAIAEDENGLYAFTVSPSS